jgi:hypothetical protein
MGYKSEQTILKRKCTNGQQCNGKKIHSVSLIPREVQIKTTKKCHLTPVQMAVIKKPKKSKKGELLHTVVRI